MAKTVLRMGGNEITHVFFVTIDGTHHYLTKADSERIMDISEEDVEMYYSGEDHDEVLSLKEDVSNLLTGNISLEVLKLRIAMHNGVIKDKVLEING